jgi:hypothetical protein
MDHDHDVMPDPTLIARCRELLGEEANGLSDREVDHIRQHADALAHVIIDMYLEEQAASE